MIPDDDDQLEQLRTAKRARRCLSLCVCARANLCVCVCVCTIVYVRVRVARFGCVSHTDLAKTDCNSDLSAAQTDNRSKVVALVVSESFGVDVVGVIGETLLLAPRSSAEQV